MTRGSAKAFIEARIREEDRGYSSPCWIWQRCLTDKGYAKSEIPGFGKNKRVHRATYELWVGPIPDGLQIDHLCNVKCCVNPAHLEPVTNLENQARRYPPGWVPAKKWSKAKYPGVGKGRYPRIPKKHCPNGHEYAPGNVLPRSDGSRRCAACYVTNAATRNRQKRERKAAARIFRAGGAVATDSGQFRTGDRPSHGHHGRQL